MTDASPNPIFKAALDEARKDYAAVKERREQLLQQIDAEEKRIRIYRQLIEALAWLLGEPHGLPPTEENVRRFRMKV